MIVSSAETNGTFNLDFDTSDLQRPTLAAAAFSALVYRCKLTLKAIFKSESS